MYIPLQHLVLESKFWKNLTHHNVIKIDNSLFTHLAACDVKGLLHVVLRKEKDYQSVDLNFGSVIHDSIDFYHLSEGSVEQVQTFAREHDLWPIIVDEKRYKTQDNLLKAIETYIKQYETKKPYQVLKGEEGLPLVERPFENYLGSISVFSLGSINVLWQGKIDAIVKKHEAIWCLDHKTTKQLGSGFKSKYLRSNQFMGYYDALLTELDGLKLNVDLPVEGALLNAICTRIKGVEIPEPYQLPYFKRQLPEWRQDVLESLRKFVVALMEYMETSKIACNRTSCYLFNKCSYWDICQKQHPDVRARILQGDEFVTSSWSPLNKAN